MRWERNIRQQNNQNFNQAFNTLDSFFISSVKKALKISSKKIYKIFNFLSFINTKRIKNFYAIKYLIAQQHQNNERYLVAHVLPK